MGADPGIRPRCKKFGLGGVRVGEGERALCASLTGIWGRAHAAVSGSPWAEPLARVSAGKAPMKLKDIHFLMPMGEIWIWRALVQDFSVVLKLIQKN